MQIAVIGNKTVPYEQLDPVYQDRAFYFGDGVYEVIRSYQGKLFALDEHISRFGRSLAEISICGVDLNQIREKVIKAFEQAAIPNAKIYFHITRGQQQRSHSWVQKAFNASGISNAKIYFHITRGSAQRKHTFDANLKPNFFLTVTELPDASQAKAEGIAVSTFPDWRWKRCDIKSLNLLANVLARQDAADKGCDEAILVDEKGLITEGAGSAFFAVFADRLQTAPLTSNILASITRRYVIKAAKELGLKVVEESLKPESAKSADELFIAVTTKDIVGVVRFDDITIGDGKVGAKTKELMLRFLEFTR